MSRFVNGYKRKWLLVCILFPLFSFYKDIHLLKRNSVPSADTVWDKTKSNTPALISLLKNPLDLQEFKRLKNATSNSGGGGKNSYYFRPPYKGFYYSYFLFEGFGDGESGPRIITYKKGGEIGGYMDSTEVLIQVSSNRSDKDLRKCNLVGMRIKDVIEKFGDRYLQDGALYFYQHQSTLFILEMKVQVLWFKIVRLNKPFISLAEIKKEESFLNWW